MDINILKFVDNYGPGGVALLILVFLANSIVKSKWFSEWWSRMTDRIIEWFMKRKTKNADIDISESDIINHDLFNYIDFWINSKIPTLEFSSEYRTIVFKRYLSSFLKSYQEVIFKFVSDGDYKSMDQSELRKSLLELTNSIISSYEKRSELLGVPSIVISKMKSKNNDTIYLTIELIQNIINSNFYQSENNFLKMFSILNIILSVLESTINSSEVVCKSINGQLKGFKIEDRGKIYTEPY